MKKLPKTKKSKRTVRMTNDKGDDVVVTQTFDIEQFKSVYTKWKASCVGMSAKEMGVKGGENLFKVISKHGLPTAQRPQAKNPVSEDEGIGKLLKEIDDIVGDNALLTESFKDDVLDAKKQLEDIANTDADPRNIPFTVPMYRRVNKKTAAYDEKKHTTRYYGHYRTPDYVKFRNLKAKVFDNKKFEEDIPAVDSSYYEKDKNKSKPPMWQALFSTDGDSGKDIKVGLLSVLETAEDMIDDVEVDHIKLVLRGVARGGLAKELYDIPDIRETILNLLGTSTDIGQGVNPKTGNIRDDQISRLFKNRLSFIAESPAESKKIKDVYGVDKELLGKIKGYSLDITRGMVKNLFVATGKVGRRSPKGPVYLKGYTPPSEKKKKKEVKKSWKEMLVS
tara:strand:+ start:3779 stop:4954 length:1176 start_codon:yes stop_codon:yes gene_type:complete